MATTFADGRPSLRHFSLTAVNLLLQYDVHSKRKLKAKEKSMAPCKSDGVVMVHEETKKHKQSLLLLADDQKCKPSMYMLIRIEHVVLLLLLLSTKERY